MLTSLLAPEAGLMVQVEECTGNPSVSRATSRLSPHFLPDHVVRAAAAAEGLVKEIEVMMGAATATKSKQPLHSTKPLLSLRHKPQPPAPSEEQKEPCRQTKLDRAVVAAVQAVNKLDKIPMMSRVPHNAAPQAAAARKWPTPPEKAFKEVTVGGGFYDQMHQVRFCLLSTFKKSLNRYACLRYMMGCSLNSSPGLVLDMGIDDIRIKGCVVIKEPSYISNILYNIYTLVLASYMQLKP